MRARCLTARLLAGAAAVCLWPSIGWPQLPLEELAKHPLIRAPDVSPDGNRLVYIAGTDSGPLVVAYDVAAQRVTPVLRGTTGEFTVSFCGFKTDDRLICGFRASERMTGGFYTVTRLLAVNVDGTGIRPLVQNGRGAGAQLQDQLLHWLPDDPRHVLIEVDDDQDVYPSVFRLDVVDGSMELVLRERPPITSWMADRAGVVRFGYGFRREEAQYVARTGADAPWRVLEKFKFTEGGSFAPLAFGAHPDLLLVAAPHHGRTAIWEMDLSENKELQLVYAHPEVDVSAALIWPADGRIVGFPYETDRPQRYLFDPTARSVLQTVDAVLEGAFNEVIGGSRNGRRLLVRSYSDVKPESFHLLDLDGGKLLALGSTLPSAPSASFAPMRTVSVPGPDGISIPGYLTVPPGREARDLPAVVYPHGGPYARDHWGFDPVVQMLASRGYAVLQLNFRGSTGYGGAWEEAGHQGWGTVMHEDITAGARWLMAEGIADPRRMCIVGWSYGGYAALIGAVKEPDLYRCVASIAGVSDLIALQWEDSRFYGGREAVRDSTGTDKRALAESSPVRHAERIKVPVLLIHGDRDIQVDVHHSNAMAKALRRADVPHELVVIPDGDHSLARPDWRLTLYRKLEAFLAEHLGGS